MTDCGSDEVPCIPQRVESERLLIRPTTRADLPYLQRWWNNPAVMDPTGNLDGMQYDERDMDAWYARHIAGRHVAHHFMICLRTGAQQPIGEFYIDCDDRPGSVSFGLVIGEIDLWNKGYGREAVTSYARAVFAGDVCSALRTEIRRSNKHAIQWCSSIGFEIEHVWANGRAVTMILTRSAFEERYGQVRTY